MSKNKKKKLPLVYQPVGLVLGLAGGAISSFAFRKTWKAIRHEDDTPDALDRDRGWGEVLLAAALQGAIFAAVRSVVNRAGAKAIERSTGSWPTKESAEKNDQD
ncbi:hypothetical protein SGFS_101390 [Streptomyces graminofaciens]|jgi:hypothetical protein|uniref:Integral membrane protein n=1 Tax=Streptomyces graminofaciens TaxID=68212 RepID=A0ABM7FL65_9ACTN|nr:DUF4235 domain-containing protein [Streptomyces graminofaciens]BBC38845.1 hypothetical protein SGFS_101390 [Streptomyces graminofaciens]